MGVSQMQISRVLRAALGQLSDLVEPDADPCGHQEDVHCGPETP